MAGRKMANILREVHDEDGFVQQILATEQLWTVTYKGDPISVKQFNKYAEGYTKYLKCTFPNKAPAVNLASKLNRKFSSLEFTASMVGVKGQ